MGGDEEDSRRVFLINCIYKLESSGLLKRPLLLSPWKFCYGYMRWKPGKAPGIDSNVYLVPSILHHSRLRSPVLTTSLESVDWSCMSLGRNGREKSERVRGWNTLGFCLAGPVLIPVAGQITMSW